MKAGEADILDRLRKHPNEVLVELYRDYRKEFMSWSYKSFGADTDVASDCFQDAMIVLYKNVQNGKLTDLQSSIKTYLFSIGRNVLLRRFEAERREVPMSEHGYSEEVLEDIEFPELYAGNKAENKIAALMQSLKDPCKSILRYFYFRGFSMEEIADVMNYKNAQTVKAQKLRCIKEMQSLVHRQMRTAL